MDGASKGHISAGGGVVRDCYGDFIGGFSSPYDAEDVVETEIRALLDGMNFCVATGISNVCIETDASMVVKMLEDD